MNPDQNINENIVSSLPPPTNRGRGTSRKAILAAVFILIIATLLVGTLVLIIKKSDKSPTTVINSKLDHGSIILSNGKEFHLGQSREYVETELGLKKEATATEDVYLYPTNTSLANPLQATLFVDNNKIVAVRLVRDKGNKQKQTNIYPATPTGEITTKTSGQAKSISEVLKKGVAQGFILQDPSVTSYYLVDTCSQRADQVVVVAIALTGYESQAKGTGAGCGIRS